MATFSFRFERIRGRQAVLAVAPLAALSLASIVLTVAAGGQTPEPENAARIVKTSPRVIGGSRAEEPDVKAPLPALPSLRYVNSPNVLLEYELLKVGKSGVGSVDLWMTRNDGKTWDRYAQDPGVKGANLAANQQAAVELPGEGVYGIRLVARSRAGLGKPPPQPGSPRYESRSTRLLPRSNS